MSTTVSMDALGRSAGAAISQSDFTTIANVVHSRSGIVLGLEKAYLVESRLAPVVRKRGFSTLCELSACLRGAGDETLAHDVVEAMTTNETLFFRDTRPFDYLRRHVLPALQTMRPAGQPLRIWSAAASSGQECYSIALTVLEGPRGERPVQILGTDISAEQVGRGRRGIYSEFEVRRGVPPQTLDRHFSRVAEGWQISDALRAMVEFRVFNLLDDSRALGSFDAVFCRNVLIYFDLATKRRVLQSIWERLLPGGLLFLGGAETVLGVSDRFAPVAGTVQVYAAVPA